MSAYIFMKILESTPGRYDRGIRILTLGKLDKAYDNLISHVKARQRVLDLGTGTGVLALKAAQKNAIVKGIDTNPQMLAIASERARELSLEQNIEFCEIGVAELDKEETESYDAVMSGLCFSELTEDELGYTLRQILRILKPGGNLLVADEVVPDNIIIRVCTRLVRIPLAIITYILTQTTSHAVRDLSGKVKASGLSIKEIKANRMGTFIELVAIKPERAGR